MRRKSKETPHSSRPTTGASKGVAQADSSKRKPAKRATPKAAGGRGRKEAEPIAVDSTSQPKKDGSEKSTKTTKPKADTPRRSVPQVKPSGTQQSTATKKPTSKRKARKPQNSAKDQTVSKEKPLQSKQTKSIGKTSSVQSSDRRSASRPESKATASRIAKAKGKPPNEVIKRIPKQLMKSLPAVDKSNKDQIPARWTPNFDAIPDCIKNLVAWVLWRWEWRGKQWTKPPCQPDRRLAKVNDEQTWSTFTAVKEACSGDESFAGVGITLTSNLNIVAIDVDKCIDAEGNINEIGQKALAAFKGTYWEVSPSGTGLRFLVYAKMPEGRKGRKNAHTNVECYCDARYVTMTGITVGAAKPVLEMAEKFDEWYLESFAAQPSNDTLKKTSGRRKDTPLTPKAIRVIAEASGSSRFDRLWSGDLSDYEGDHSSADLALCSFLARAADGDADLINQCFVASGLYREKWDRDDYRDRTISKALEGVQTSDTDGELLPAIDSARPFPIDSLPEPVREIAREASTAHGCAIQSGALMVIVCCATAIRKRVELKLKEGSVVNAILWGVVIAESGSGKSPLLRSLMAPLSKLQNTLYNQYKAAKKEYERLAKLQSRRRNATSTDSPVEPVLKQLFTADATIEAMLSCMSRGKNFLAVVVDELGGWLSSFSRYSKSSSVSQWISLYDKSSPVVNRKTDNEVFCASDAGACILGTIQPAILAKNCTGENIANGLAARFLMVSDESPSQQWSSVEITTETAQAYEDLIQSLANLNGSFPTSQTVTLSPDAGRIFERQFNDVTDDLNQKSGPVEIQLQKLKMVHGRIALVLHCIEQALSGTPSGVITEATMLKAVEIANWFRFEAIRVHQLLSTSVIDENLKKTADLIRRKGGSITAAELARSSRIYSSSEAADKGLQKLVGLGYGRWETIPKSRRFVLDNLKN